eukprot:10763170-Lingulodinium_polyedra.AAC.1
MSAAKRLFRGVLCVVRRERFGPILRKRPGQFFAPWWRPLARTRGEATLPKTPSARPEVGASMPC